MPIKIFFVATNVYMQYNKWNMLTINTGTGSINKMFKQIEYVL